ncbi:uncharacterized protein LOC135926732 [Gordionus sp. m RMFG-2023]|uniref:uncharacterized protein LOC135926732 n=1 Tax=Gordionus sp. m RMFG-2023 TaxID=3053472 RepID=UPI0031FE09C2
MTEKELVNDFWASYELDIGFSAFFKIVPIDNHNIINLLSIMAQTSPSNCVRSINYLAQKFGQKSTNSFLYEETIIPEDYYALLDQISVFVDKLISTPLPIHPDSKKLLNSMSDDLVTCHAAVFLLFAPFKLPDNNNDKTIVQSDPFPQIQILSFKNQPLTKGQLKVILNLLLISSCKMMKFSSELLCETITHSAKSGNIDKEIKEGGLNLEEKRLVDILESGIQKCLESILLAAKISKTNDESTDDDQFLQYWKHVCRSSFLPFLTTDKILAEKIKMDIDLESPIQSSLYGKNGVAVGRKFPITQIFVKILSEITGHSSYRVSLLNDPYYKSCIIVLLRGVVPHITSSRDDDITCYMQTCNQILKIVQCLTENFSFIENDANLSLNDFVYRQFYEAHSELFSFLIEVIVWCYDCYNNSDQDPCSNIEHLPPDSRYDFTSFYPLLESLNLTCLSTLTKLLYNLNNCVKSTKIAAITSSLHQNISNVLNFCLPSPTIKPVDYNNKITKRTFIFNVLLGHIIRCHDFSLLTSNPTSQSLNPNNPSLLLIQPKSFILALTALRHIIDLNNLRNSIDPKNLTRNNIYTYFSSAFHNISPTFALANIPTEPKLFAIALFATLKNCNQRSFTTSSNNANNTYQMSMTVSLCIYAFLGSLTKCHRDPTFLYLLFTQNCGILDNPTLSPTEIILLDLKPSLPKSITCACLKLVSSITARCDINPALLSAFRSSIYVFENIARNCIEKDISHATSFSSFTNDEENGIAKNFFMNEFLESISCITHALDVLIALDFHNPETENDNRPKISQNTQRNTETRKLLGGCLPMLSSIFKAITHQISPSTANPENNEKFFDHTIANSVLCRFFLRKHNSLENTKICSALDLFFDSLSRAARYSARNVEDHISFCDLALATTQIFAVNPWWCSSLDREILSGTDEHEDLVYHNLLFSILRFAETVILFNDKCVSVPSMQSSHSSIDNVNEEIFKSKSLEPLLSGLTNILEYIDENQLNMTSQNPRVHALVCNIFLSLFLSFEKINKVPSNINCKNDDNNDEKENELNNRCLLKANIAALAKNGFLALNLFARKFVNLLEQRRKNAGISLTFTIDVDVFSLTYLALIRAMFSNPCHYRMYGLTASKYHMLKDRVDKETREESIARKDDSDIFINLFRTLLRFSYGYLAEGRDGSTGSSLDNKVVTDYEEFLASSTLETLATICVSHPKNRKIPDGYTQFWLNFVVQTCLIDSGYIDKMLFLPLDFPSTRTDAKNRGSSCFPSILDWDDKTYGSLVKLLTCRLISTLPYPTLSATCFKAIWSNFCPLLARLAFIQPFFPHLTNNNVIRNTSVMIPPLTLLISPTHVGYKWALSSSKLLFGLISSTPQLSLPHFNKTDDPTDFISPCISIAIHQCTAYLSKPLSLEEQIRMVRRCEPVLTSLSLYSNGNRSMNNFDTEMMILKSRLFELLHYHLTILRNMTFDLNKLVIALYDVSIFGQCNHFLSLNFSAPHIMSTLPYNPDSDLPYRSSKHEHLLSYGALLALLKVCLKEIEYNFPSNPLFSPSNKGSLLKSENYQTTTLFRRRSSPFSEKRKSLSEQPVDPKNIKEANKGNTQAGSFNLNNDKCLDGLTQRALYRLEGNVHRSLEIALYILVSQAILYLKNPQHSINEKAFLKQELCAELNALFDAYSWPCYYTNIRRKRMNESFEDSFEIDQMTSSNGNTEEESLRYFELMTNLILYIQNCL